MGIARPVESIQATRKYGYRAGKCRTRVHFLGWHLYYRGLSRRGELPVALGILVGKKKTDRGMGSRITLNISCIVSSIFRGCGKRGMFCRISGM